MLSWITRWIDHRKAARRRLQNDAAFLIVKDERNAYYEAQRLAARYRARGDGSEFVHWARVAAEIARQSPSAEMNLSRVQQIVDDELQHRA